MKKCLPFTVKILEEITTVAVSPDNQHLLSISTDHTMKLFDLKSREEVYHSEPIHDGNLMRDPFA